MGVAAGYNAKQLAPFLLSLSETSYKGRVVMFVENMDAISCEQVRAMGAEVVILDNQYEVSLRNPLVRVGASVAKWMRKTRGFRKHYPKAFRAAMALPLRDKARLWKDLERAVEGFQSLRYHHYLEFLNSQGQDADFVMICDTRDIVFQSDPFDPTLDDELIVVLENQDLRINVESFNSNWIRDLYGNKGLQQVGSHTVSCSGTVMGTRQGMARYLQLMSQEVFRQTQPLGSHDQGIHNFLLRTSRLDPVSIQANLHAPVLTLGKEPNVKRDEAGRLLNQSGEPAPIVHQYDRHQNLASEIISKYDVGFQQITDACKSSY